MDDEATVEPRVRARRAAERDRTRFAERPTPAAHAEHELADDPGGRERAEPVRDHLRHAARAEHDRDDHRDRADPGRDQQTLPEHLATRRAPRQRGRDGHEEEEREPDRRGHPVEVRLSHRQPAAAQRLGDEREHGAEQHDERESREQEVVGEKRRLPRHRRVDAPG